MRFGKGGSRSIYVMVFLWLVSISVAIAQKPVKHFHEKDFDPTLYKGFETNKEIPDLIRAQALIALSYYPELREVPIVFRFRKRKTPLTSRPRLLSSLKKRGDRCYVITISCKSGPKLSPILFFNLPYNAQIGVLGHELGHITTYNSMKTVNLLGLIFKLANPEYADRFEFKTDLISIRHGLGYQLYEWSSYVRRALSISEWRVASEDYSSDPGSLSNQRYMNPQTIEIYMDSMVLYQAVRKNPAGLKE